MPPGLPPSLAGYNLSQFKGPGAVRRPMMGSMGTKRNLGTGRAAMPEPVVENVESNSEKVYNGITSNLSGQSPNRAILNYINNHIEEFPQHRIDELIAYAKDKGVNFGELTIPTAEKKGIFSGGRSRMRTRKMRRGTRKMRARKGKSRRSRR